MQKECKIDFENDRENNAVDVLQHIVQQANCADPGLIAASNFGETPAWSRKTLQQNSWETQQESLQLFYNALK